MANFDTIEFRFVPKKLIDNPEKIEKGLALKKKKIDRWQANPEDFIDENVDGYSAYEVAKDLREVEILESLWEEENEVEKNTSSRLRNFTRVFSSMA